MLFCWEDLMRSWKPPPNSATHTIDQCRALQTNKYMARKQHGSPCMCLEHRSGQIWPSITRSPSAQILNEIQKVPSKRQWINQNQNHALPGGHPKLCGGFSSTATVWVDAKNIKKHPQGVPQSAMVRSTSRYE